MLEEVAALGCLKYLSSMNLVRTAWVLKHLLELVP